MSLASITKCSAAWFNWNVKDSPVKGCVSSKVSSANSQKIRKREGSERVIGERRPTVMITIEDGVVFMV